MRTALLASAVATGLVAAVGIGAGTYLTVGKSVTVTVDGKANEVHTFAGTVDDVLEAEGIEVSERDVVAPAPSAAISDGTRIAVRYARPLELTVDGETTTHWTTATSVGDAFDQLGLRLRGAELSASRSAGIERKGLSVDVATNKRLTIVHDGEKTDVETTGSLVSDALAEADLSLGPDDRVKPAVTADLVDGETIKITRVEIKTRKVEIEIPFETTRTADSDLYEDEEEVEEEGQTGLKVETRKITFVDGKRKDTEVVKTEQVREPVDEVVRYGTKERPEPEPQGDGDGGGGNTGTDADSLNWAGLAECESGGNPRAVNPAGYYGLYQFALSTWQSVGGSGNPIDASPDEQTYRAKLLYDKAGAGQWPVCGKYLFN